MGNVTVTLSANTAGAPAAKTKTFALHVTAPPPDFTLAVTATPATTVAGTNVTWSGTLTAVNGYNKNVTLSCTAGSTAAPSTCSFSPNPVLPTSGGAAFTVTVGSSTNGTYSFNIQGVGTDSTTHSQAVSLTVNGTFTVPGTLTNPAAANPGQTTTTTMQLTPVGDSTFTSSVSYSCTSGLPAGATCSFAPTSPLASGASATNVTVTVNTAGPFTGTAGTTTRSARPRAQNDKPRLWLPLTLPLFGVVFVGLAGRKLSRRHKIAGLCLMLVLTAFMVACGGGGSSTPPPPPVAVTVSPSSVNTLWPNLSGAPSQTQQFTATVTGTTNTAVTWSISSGGTTDTISTTGLYTAPTSAPSGAVTVKATSQADATKSNTATVNIKTPTPTGNYPITVTVTEGSLAPQTTTFSLAVN